MAEIETDYLVIGAGASGMAFVDALLSGSPDARVVLVDRLHRPGGHWVNAYPFVRLHQPSANYGVTSRRLGEDRIDTAGINAGFYERASSQEICDYYSRVLEHELLASGRVRFLAMTDYRGVDGDGHHVTSHHVTSLLTGADTTIRAKQLVDATYIYSEIPSRHAPAYDVDPGVRLMPPNDLVDLGSPADGFTIIGCGKTAMDTCVWLLDVGVDPDRIQWIKTRDAWLFNRVFMQPLELVGQYMDMQARYVQAAAEATDGTDFGRRLEAADVFVRIDPDVEPVVFRGATISTDEVDALRSIERLVRKGRVRSVEPRRLVLDDGEVSTGPNEVYVDCTAAGVRPAPPVPVWGADRITLQYVTIGIAPWSAATIGTVEAAREDRDEKNRLCPPLAFTGNIADSLRLSYAGMTGLTTRAGEPDLAAWNEQCRLNPAMGAMARASEPQIAAAFTSLITNMGPALANVAQHAGVSLQPPSQREPSQERATTT